MVRNYYYDNFNELYEFIQLNNLNLFLLNEINLFSFILFNLSLNSNYLLFYLIFKQNSFILIIKILNSLYFSKKSLIYLLEDSLNELYRNNLIIKLTNNLNFNNLWYILIKCLLINELKLLLEMISKKKCKG